MDHCMPRYAAALTATAVVLGIGVRTAGQTRSAARAASDGLVRSELSLRGYTARIVYPPMLRADDPSHRGVLTANRAAGPARVRVGQLQTDGPLAIGAVELGTNSRTEIRYDLSLEADDDGWILEAADAAAADPSAATVRRIPLERRMSGTAAPDFVAALIPEDGSTARLVVRWGPFDAQAAVRYAERGRRRSDETPPPNATVNRKHDEDTSALSRARLLAQRNETALVFATGERLSVSFQRTADAAERVGTSGGLRTRGLPADGPDFARIGSAAPGSVVLLTEAAVPRLRIERPVRFDRAALALGNQVPGFPGSYGLWLKRARDGWRLVFNHEPDAWGSQHDPKFDASEIELRHSDGHAAARPFAVGLMPTGADRGRLLIVWGPHEWTADFAIGS